MGPDREIVKMRGNFLVGLVASGASFPPPVGRSDVAGDWVLGSSVCDTLFGMGGKALLFINLKCLKRICSVLALIKEALVVRKPTKKRFAQRQKYPPRGI